MMGVSYQAVLSSWPKAKTRAGTPCGSITVAPTPPFTKVNISQTRVAWTLLEQFRAPPAGICRHRLSDT